MAFWSWTLEMLGLRRAGSSRNLRAWTWRSQRKALESLKLEHHFLTLTKETFKVLLNRRERRNRHRSHCTSFTNTTKMRMATIALDTLEIVTGLLALSTIASDKMMRLTLNFWKTLRRSSPRSAGLKMWTSIKFGLITAFRAKRRESPDTISYLLLRLLMKLKNIQENEHRVLSRLLPDFI